jgi:hypothetical protein
MARLVPEWIGGSLQNRHGGNAGQSGARGGRLLLTLAGNLVASLALYYVLRAAGLGTYLTLLIWAFVPAVSAAFTFVRHRTVDQLSLFVLTMPLLGAAVSLLTGSPRFLLAKDGGLTAVTGVWFLLSLRARRPLTFLFAQPLLEGSRLLGPASASWDDLWERVPRFRRLWHVATIMWGVGTLLDALVRVVMAYTLPVDVVPALGACLWPVTFVVLQVFTNALFWRSGFLAILHGNVDLAEASGEPARMSAWAAHGTKPSSP